MRFFTLFRTTLVVVVLFSLSSRGEAKSAHRWGIRNVIFDFGGVIVDLNNAELRRRIGRLFGSLDNPKLQRIIHQHQRGEIDLQGYRKALHQLSVKRKLKDRQIDRAWGSQIGKVDCRKLKLVEALRKKGFKTYALSTTDPLHAALIEKRFKRCLPHVRGDVFAHLFEKTFLTFRLKMLKPDPKIYRKVLAEAGLKAEETLFIDDSLHNVLGAQKAGLYSLVIRDRSFMRWLPKFLEGERR